MSKCPFCFSSCVHVGQGHPAAVCAVQGDEHRLVSAGAEGTVSIWDLRTGQELFQIYGHYGGIRSLLFDRERLITDGEARNPTPASGFLGNGTDRGGRGKRGKRGRGLRRA